MTTEQLAAGTAVYSAALWWLARRAARMREVELGTPPMVVLGAATLSAAAVAHAASAGAAELALAATIAGATIAAIFDARTGLIPDDLSLAIGASTALAAVAAGSGAASALGATCAGGSLFALYLLTARRGIGLGDVKLAVAMGIGLGPARGLVAIGAAFVLGAIVALAALASGRARRDSSMRFGPYLALGAGCAPLVAPWLLA